MEEYAKEIVTQVAGGTNLVTEDDYNIRNTSYTKVLFAWSGFDFAEGSVYDTSGEQMVINLTYFVVDTITDGVENYYYEVSESIMMEFLKAFYTNEEPWKNREILELLVKYNFMKWGSK